MPPSPGPYLIRRRGGGLAFVIGVPVKFRWQYPSRTGKPRSKVIEGLGTDSVMVARKLVARRLAFWCAVPRAVGRRRRCS